MIKMTLYRANVKVAALLLFYFSICAWLLNSLVLLCCYCCRGGAVFSRVGLTKATLLNTRQYFKKEEQNLSLSLARSIYLYNSLYIYIYLQEKLEQSFYFCSLDTRIKITTTHRLTHVCFNVHRMRRSYIMLFSLFYF